MILLFELLESPGFPVLNLGGDTALRLVGGSVEVELEIGVELGAKVELVGLGKDLDKNSKGSELVAGSRGGLIDLDCLD